MPLRRLAVFSLILLFAISGCIPIVDVIERPFPTSTTDPNAPVLPPVSALPPADFVSVRLVDGSPGLALWCDVRGDCIEAARILCDNRQSIRSEFDIDRASPGAAQYFNQSGNAAHQLTVSCPV
ncbi:MAG: hypothetical protein AAGA70_05815 [Pseudomonadota bacterium]